MDRKPAGAAAGGLGAELRLEAIDGVDVQMLVVIPQRQLELLAQQIHLQGSCAASWFQSQAPSRI